MVHFGVCGLCYLLNDSRLGHSIYSYLATFYPAVKGIRSNHCHFLWRTVTSTWRYILSLSVVGKEPIKLHPAEVQWPNTQNTNLAPPLKFCIGNLWKVEGGREGQPHQVSEGHFLFLNKGHTWSPASSVFLLLSYRATEKRKKREEKKGLAWIMISASNGRIMAHSRKTEKMG